MIRKLLTLFLLSLMLSACGSKRTASEVSPSGSDYRKTIFQQQHATTRGLQFPIPKSSTAYYNFLRGELALQMGDFASALKFFRDAAEIEDGPAPVLRKRLAQLLIRQGELLEALKQLERANEADNSLELKLLIAGIYSALGENLPAVAAYEELIALEPDNQEFYVLLSSLYIKLEQTDKAISTLERLISYNPKSPFGHYYKGRLYERQGEVDKSLQFYQKAAELNPNSEGMQVDYARVLALSGNGEQAIQIAKRVLTSNPRNAAARQLLGHLFWRGKQLEEAITELEALRMLEEDPSDTRLKIALIKMERKDFVGAETELNLVLAANSDHASANYFLASAYLGQGRIGEAVQVLKLVNPEHKVFVEAKTLQAYLHRQQGDLDAAEEALNQAIRATPEDAELLLYLGSLQRERKKFSAAIETYKKIIELDQANDQLYFTLGVLYDEVGDKAGIERAMTKAIELNPNNATALNYLGYTLALLEKELPLAVDYVKRALEIEPENGYYLDSLGWIYFKMGRYEDAYHYLAKALEFTPNDAVILEHFAEAQAVLGLRQEALATLQNALKHAPQSDDKEVKERVQQRIHNLKNEIDATNNSKN